MENKKKQNELAENRRSAIRIMGHLIGLVKPLFHIMFLAVIFGTAGYLCAVFLTILAGQVLLDGMVSQHINNIRVGQEGLSGLFSVQTIFVLMLTMAVLRGIFHYIEQYCNHYIAFKLLAIIRHKVFAALQKLCPAKLEGKEKGNLISIITTDIELLEVFYAHTISPIVIAIVTSSIMVVFMCQYHILAGMFALSAYLLAGFWLPVWNEKRGRKEGMEFRTGFGKLNSFVLDSLHGLDETIQYGQGENRKKRMSEYSGQLSGLQKKLSKLEGTQRGITNVIILAASFGMLALMLFLYGKKEAGFDGVILCTLAMMGSFGPVVALSNLSNNLTQTLASGERVLRLLEETPLVKEIKETEETKNVSDNFSGAMAEHVTFAYEDKVVLKDFSRTIEPGKITGIHGRSGCGKSTFLKLLMRFWDVQNGEVAVNGKNVKKIATRQLRDLESYVTQETYLFHDSIANNIAIAKRDASREEIIEAAKKASIHEFIEKLPKGYDSNVGELGDALSGGEKQRIGIARAFLHQAPFILMDEPTSNLDALNEGIILKSLKEASKRKTVVLVSHRKSTMNIADVVYEMNNKNIQKNT